MNGKIAKMKLNASCEALPKRSSSLIPRITLLVSWRTERLPSFHMDWIGSRALLGDFIMGFILGKGAVWIRAGFSTQRLAAPNANGRNEVTRLSNELVQIMDYAGETHKARRMASFQNSLEFGQPLSLRSS